MSFAVVKFINETDCNGIDVVQEVPVSWLCQENKMCKWPPEKYTKIYISKQYPPEPNWTEHPVEVEGIFDSLNEAHKRANNASSSAEEWGRGHRIQKPNEFFSPDEEIEKGKKKICKKKVAVDSGKQFHEMFNQGKVILDVDEAGVVTHLTKEDTQSSGDELLADSDNEENNLDILLDTNSNSCQYSETSNKGSTADSVSGTIAVSTGSASGSMLTGTLSTADAEQIHKKLDTICHFLAELKVDMSDVKQRLDVCKKKEETEQLNELPVELPMTSLNNIDELETFINSNTDIYKQFCQKLNSIGGSNAKDFTHRICRYLFANSLAVLCSWTGRKNNFGLENLSIMKAVFDVVHHKCLISKKDFENCVMEWFRHARQRWEREKKK